MNNEPTRFVDRETGEIVVEKVFGGSGLDRLYGSPISRLLTHHVLARRAINRLYGWIQRRRGSRRRIPRFVRTLDVNVDEIELPLEAYESMDHFFTRRLGPEARPIDPTPDHLISPADGRALVFPALEGTRLPIKGRRVELTELLGGVPARPATSPTAGTAPYASHGRAYADGSALVVRLAPADYHRFHFPDGGIAHESRTSGHRLHSVHPIALDAGAPSFLNKRTVTLLESEHFGPLLLVEVGALLVGRIVQTHSPGTVSRGQEKGYFSFGGSTVILLARPGVLTFDRDLVEHSRRGLETRVKFGTRVASA